MASSGLVLRTIRGPDQVEVPLSAAGLIGRSGEAETVLPDPAVSRRHARVMILGGRPHLVDQRSSAGTVVNGVRVAAGVPVPLREGDIIGVGPWVFRVADPEAADSTAGTRFDHGGAGVERLEPAGDSQLATVMDCLAAVRAAESEREVAEIVVRTAVSAGVPRAAVLRPMGGERFETLASHPVSSSKFRFSKTLLEGAADGEAVTLRSADTPVGSHSVVALAIRTAVAFPLRVGDTVESVLYCDARGTERPLGARQIRLIEALSQAASFALTERRHSELSERQRVLSHDLDAAREVQRGLMAPERGSSGAWRYAMGSQPGAYVAGDLFDAVELPGRGLAVVAGDVVGHGVGAGLAMAMTQAFLHAQLGFLNDPVSAVSALNGFLATRLTGGRFVTLFVGLLQEDGAVIAVDAGHGHFRVVSAGGVVRSLPLPGTPPVGVAAGVAYHALEFALSAGEMLVVFTDGLVEQVGAEGEMFGVERLERVLGGVEVEPGAAVRALLGELDAFRGSVALADDATVAAFAFGGGGAGNATGGGVPPAAG